MSFDKTGAFTTANYEQLTASKAAKLFDGLPYTYWYGSSVPSWAQIRVDIAQTVTRYTVQGYSNDRYSPTEWQLLGSNDGATWTTLDSRTGQDVRATSGWYDCATPGSYIYYRFNVTANGGWDYPVIAYELVLDVPAAPPPPPPLAVTIAASVAISVLGLSGLGPMNLGVIDLGVSVATATSIDGWMTKIDLGTIALAAGSAVEMSVAQPGTLASPYAAADSDTRSLDFASALFVATEPVARTGPPVAPSIWYEFTESQVADWLASTSGFASGADIELYSGPPGAGPGDLTFIATDGSVVLTLGAVTVAAMPVTALGAFQVESVDLGAVTVAAMPVIVLIESVDLGAVIVTASPATVMALS